MDFKAFFLLLLVIVLLSLGVSIHLGWVPSPNAVIRAYAMKKTMNEMTSKVDLKKMMISPVAAIKGGEASASK